MRLFQPRLWTLTGLLLGLASLCGCGLSVGPQVEQRIIFVKYQGVAARVMESKTVKVTVTDANGHTYVDKIDIAGFYVISPDMKDEKP